jgi:signal transduction histidine kinase
MSFAIPEMSDTRQGRGHAGGRMPLVWLLAVAGIVCAVAVAVLLLWQDYRAVTEAGRQRAASLTEIAAAHVQQTLTAIEVAMQALDGPVVANERADPAGLEEMLARVGRILPALGNLRVLDAQGRAVLADAPMPEDTGAAFAYHRDNPGDALRLDWAGPVSGKLLVSRRISRADGSFAGVAQGDLDPHSFHAFFGTLGAERVALHLSDGRAIEIYPHDAVASVEPFVASATLQGLGLAIDVELSRQSFLGAWEDKRNVGAALTLVTIASLLGGAYALRHHNHQASALNAAQSRNRAEALARSRADEASRRKSDFVSQMSHELRTPLNAIIGFSEVIKSASFGPVGQPKYQEYADDIHYSAQHLLSVINNILDLSKVEAGKWHMADEHMTLHELFDALQRLAGERANRENVHLAINPAPANLTLRGDKRTLLQIMLNLTINAIKFAGPDRRVDLHVHELADGGLAINIADHGDGMSAEELERAMRPFDAPAQGINRKKQDTGLGLPLAAAFAELHGGKVELLSAPGAGTTARLILPPARVLSLGQAKLH